MVSTLRRGTAWRWLAIAVLLAGLVLPFMPTAAYAASDTTTMATAKQDTNWYGFACRDYYRVRQGDHLLQIARWFGVSLHDIAAANGITNPSIIWPGQLLCIPAASHVGGPGHPGGPGGPGHGGCWYTVRSGDNLSRIAAAHGTTWPHLAHINHLANPRIVVPGQVLNVCG